MGKHDRVARLEVRRDLVVVHLALDGIGQEDHDHVGLGGGVGHAENAQAIGFGLGLAARAFMQPHTHIGARIAQVQRMRVPLATIADNGNLLALEQSQVRLILVVNLCHEVVRLDSLVRVCVNYRLPMTNDQ